MPSTEALTKKFDSIDSHPENDSARIGALLFAAWECTLTDPDKARELALRAHDLAEKLGSADELAESQLLLARCKGGADQYEEAVEDALLALQVFIERSHIVGQIRAYRVLGFIYSRYGKFDKSLENLFKGVKLLTESGYDVREGPYPTTAILYNNIAYIFAETGRSAEALDYFFKAYELARSCEGTMTITVLINIAETELDLGDTKMALRYNKMALTELNRHKHTDQDLHNCYNAFGLIYRKMGQYDLALDSFLKAREAAQRASSKFSLIVSSLDIARLHLLQGHAALAVETINEVQSSAEEIEANALMRDIHQVKAQAYEELGDCAQALQHYKQYMERSRAVDIRNMEQRITQYETEFRIEQAHKDAEIYRLRNIELKQKSDEIEQKALQLEQSNRFITIISEIGQRITALLDLEDVFNTIYLSVNRLMDARAFAIGFYNAAIDAVEMDFVIEDKKRRPPFRLEGSDDGFVMECVHTGVFAVDNHLAGEKYDNVFVTNGQQPRSAVFCPLLIAGRVLGVLTLQSYYPDAYNSNHIDIIRALASYIAIALNNSQQSESLKVTARELDLLSKTDPLTGLYTRRHIIDKMEEEYRRYQRYGKKFTLMLVDIDYFKKINDAYGHTCGDHVLIAVSEQMKMMLRQQDCLARWGGEEFLILLPETSAQKAVALAERLRNKIASMEFKFREHSLHITMTIGLCESGKTTTIDELIMRADHALYEGKDRDRNCVRVYGEQ